MIVDYSVYEELPESVQQELQSNYNLKFQKPEKEVEKKQQDWISELPPWSQLDPTSLLALPDTIREQVIEAYGNKNKPKSSPESKSTTLPLQMEDLPYDVNVWNELPLGK